LANSPQTRKRARQNVIRNQRNRSYRSSIRTSIKALLKAINAGDKDAAPVAYRQVTSVIDKGAIKGLMHRNTAARLKSRLNKRLQGLATA
jgi:small subunit ribosomal protein S20